MKVALHIRSVLGQRQSICCTHSELLLFPHAMHVCRVGGLHLAKSSIRDFVAMSVWAVGLPALASRRELDSMHGDSQRMTVKDRRKGWRQILRVRKLCNTSEPPLSPICRLPYYCDLPVIESMRCRDVCRSNPIAYSRDARLSELRRLAYFRAPSDTPNAFGSILIDWLRSLGHCISECRAVWGQDIVIRLR